MFKALKHVTSLFKEGDKPKRILVIHAEKQEGSTTRLIRVSESIYPTLKLLLRDIAEMHGVELEIVEE